MQAALLEAARDPFRFLAARGWRPLPEGNGHWRNEDERVLTAAQAIQAELETIAEPETIGEPDAEPQPT
jgi:hypothetical protein